MSAERIAIAVDRIERALSRIEAEASAPRAAHADDARHQALKAQVAASLAQLDALIEGLEQ